MLPIPHEVPKTKGAVLIGGLAATLLTGSVYVQAIVYFKLYSSDMWQIKALVLVVWYGGNDVFIWLALWSYFILNFGREQGVDALNWELGIVIIFTGLVTYLAHLFYTYRLYRLAKRKNLIAPLILILASMRVVFGIANGAQMLHYETISRYRMDAGWIFTTGLVMSAAVDVLLTISLISVLYTKGRGIPRLNGVVGLLIQYAFETACVTCAGSLACVFCWTLMPRNLVFLGLYFVVGKLYANSLLSTLNVRKYIRQTSLETFPKTSVERMQFRPGRVAGSLSSEGLQLHDDQCFNPAQRIARVSGGEGYHISDMSCAETGRPCAPSRIKPPCPRSSDCIHPKGRTVVEVKVEKKVSDR